VDLRGEMRQKMRQEMRQEILRGRPPGGREG